MALRLVMASLFIPLLILNLPSIANAGKKCGDMIKDKDNTGMAVVKILSAISSGIHGQTGALMNTVITFIDAIDKDEDDTLSAIKCYIEEYHTDRVTIRLTNFKNRFVNREGNLRLLQRLLEDIEGDVDYLQTRLDHIKAAVYPIIPLWAKLHHEVYSEIIALSRTGTRKLKENSDKWLVFYCNMMLRYAKAYRHSRMARLNDNEARQIKYSPLMESPVEKLADWKDLAYYSGSIQKLNNLMNSCKLVHRSMVEFGLRKFRRWWELKKETPRFFSCWIRGTKCKHVDCPEVFVYDKDLDWGYKCRGETFWIYSDDKNIHDGNVVNILYAGSHWVSTMGRYNTKTCPGSYSRWTHIQSDCGAENLRLYKYTKAGSSQIYDGQLVHFGSDIYELYIKGECSNNEKLDIPKIHPISSHDLSPLTNLVNGVTSSHDLSPLTNLVNGVISSHDLSPLANWLNRLKLRVKVCTKTPCQP